LRIVWILINGEEEEEVGRKRDKAEESRKEEAIPNTYALAELVSS
jgi:hypothetical protein